MTTSETIEIRPQTGVAFELKKGQKLRVATPTGNQVSDLFCVNKIDIGEYFSAARSLDYADKIYLSVHDVLYSNRSQRMLTILEDSCGHHDLLMPPCSLKMFRIVSGDNNYHPSCLENLSRALSQFGVTEDAIATSFNIFMNVKIFESGEVRICAPLAKPDDSIVFRAEMDLYVGLTACSHEETNAGSCKPINYEILAGDF